jgi:hypothetical protein
MRLEIPFDGWFLNVTSQKSTLDFNRREYERQCGKPRATATSKVGQQTGQWARTLCGDFGTAKQGSGLQGGVRQAVRDQVFLGFEDGLDHLRSIQIDESDLVHSTACQI